MLSTSLHPASADGLRWYPVYGLQDASDISCFIDAQPYDIQLPFGHPEGIDPQLLLLGDPQLFDFDFGFDVTTNLSYPSESEILFDSSHSFGWPQEPYFRQCTIPEMEVSGSVGPIGGPAIQPGSEAARSCSPASDSSIFSDGASSLTFSDSSAGGQSPQPASNPSPSAGPSGSQVGQFMVGRDLSSIGPVRRGRGRPRKDAPPVYQPPPLCDYVDPLTGVSCGKLLNRHHDLPRHMVKHRQEEAALVNAGRLARESARLLPPDWKYTDELKLPCRFCSATFSRTDAVKRHEKREHKHRPRKG